MLCTAEMTYEHTRLCIAINLKIEYWLLPSLFPHPASSFSRSPYTLFALITDAQTGTKKKPIYKYIPQLRT